MNIGTTRAGINMDAVADMGRIVKETAEDVFRWDDSKSGGDRWVKVSTK